MYIAYHTKTPKNGWQQLIVAPIYCPTWDANQDQFAINHMLENGTMTLTMGDSMWQIVKETTT